MLPILFVVVSLFFYRKNVKNIVYHLAYIFFTVPSIGSTLIWVFFPIASLFTTLPAGEDATKFLQSANLPPFAVAGMSVVVIFLVLFLAFWRNLPQIFIKIIKYMGTAVKDAGAVTDHSIDNFGL